MPVCTTDEVTGNGRHIREDFYEIVITVFQDKLQELLISQEFE
jgi:hypothetical protein